MFQITIGNTPIIMSKFFGTSDKDNVLAAVTENTKRVVFIDTPSTAHLVGTIESLISRGIEVVVRDHHDVPSPRNPREQEITDAANKVRSLVGSNAVISDRATHPACSGLIEAGEFAGAGTVIVADPDPDGLTAAMKALGVVYDGLDADAAVLDGARSEQTADKLSPNAFLFTRAMATLPAFDANRPQVSEDAKAKLFSDFVSVVNGDSEAQARLQKGVEAYEAGVGAAEAIAAEATRPTVGVVMADAVGKPQHDLSTLTQRLEAQPGARVTVVRKDNGPIAAKHNGVQYSLAVVKAYQADINLQELLLSGFTSSPESGIISNTTFLLHVSENIWKDEVLPKLWWLTEPECPYCRRKRSQCAHAVGVSGMCEDYA